MKKIALALVIVLLLPAIAYVAPEVEVYFSPNGGCTSRIVASIDGAESYIDIAMYSFTSRVIAHALVRARRKGVKVRVVLDAAQAFERYSKGRYLKSKGIEVVYYHGNGLMHNKVCIVDGKELFTGSFNWTASAEKRNQENLLVIHIPYVIEKFQKRLDYLFNVAKENG